NLEVLEDSRRHLVSERPATTRLGRAINSLEEIMEDLSHALQAPAATAARRSTSLLPTPG
ncbi:MAG: hypothetical protein Q8Q74_16930, partial [Polaromonas sp.]|nr:hypothetical protein [Polaromonas sp.]